MPGALQQGHHVGCCRVYGGPECVWRGVGCDGWGSGGWGWEVGRVCLSGWGVFGGAMPVFAVVME